VKLEPAGGCLRVDPFAQAREADTDGAQFIDERHEVPQVSAQAIEPPADEQVESSPLGVADQRIERGPLVGRAADSGIDNS
jgi:hypothetical protein